MAEEIDVRTLNPQQLVIAKNQVESELDTLSQSSQTLSAARQKYINSQRSLVIVEPSKQGKEILVPLTASLYMPGVIKEAGKVLIELGTGYFAEMNLEQAKQFYERKIKMITENIQKIQQLMINRKQTLALIVRTFQEKTQHLQQQMQQHQR